MKKRVLIIAALVLLAAGVTFGRPGQGPGARDGQARAAGPDNTPENTRDAAALTARLEQARALGAASWQDLHGLGVLYIHARRYGDAAQALEEAAALEPGDKKVYESLGMAYYRAGEFEKAASAWAKAREISADAGHVSALEQRAVEMASSRKRTAELQEALGRGEGGPEARRELAGLYAGMRMYDEAIREMRLAVEQDPQDAGLFDALARLHARKGDFEEAVAAAGEALRLKPGDRDAKQTLAEMEKLRDALEKGEFRHPSNAGEGSE